MQAGGHCSLVAYGDYLAGFSLDQRRVFWVANDVHSSLSIQLKTSLIDAMRHLVHAVFCLSEVNRRPLEEWIEAIAMLSARIAAGLSVFPKLTSVQTVRAYEPMLFQLVFRCKL